MSFILKTNPVVINIKLTSKGRELLSKGQLTFKKWAVGDSEIDYTFNSKIVYNSFKETILRPKDKNPKIWSFIKQDDSDETSIYTDLPSVVSNTVIMTNTATQRGFFGNVSGQTTLLTDALHCKQSDMQILISTVSGGTKLHIQQAPTYLSNTNEPIVGDYLLVKWANPLITGGTVTNLVNQTIPYVWYKIQAKSGTLTANNLVVTVDKYTPNFNGSGGSIVAGAFLYPNNNNRAISGDSVQTYYSSPFITDFATDSVNTFFENGICPIQEVPVWNMSIIFTEEIAGITSTMRNITQYDSKEYGGFVKYIERISNVIKKIGVIHFSNSSFSHHYGEGFFENTPVLDLPTIMWHYETGNTVGLKLTTEFDEQTLPDIETPFRNLVDRFGNIVGKVFNELKIFVIEDQELLFAMSYKANRNWTLPKPTLNFNLSSCVTCTILITNITVTNESAPSAGDGSIQISVSNNSGQVYYSIDNGATYHITNSFNGLNGGTYSVSVLDSGADNCFAVKSVVVTTTP